MAEPVPADEPASANDLARAHQTLPASEPVPAGPLFGSSVPDAGSPAALSVAAVDFGLVRPSSGSTQTIQITNTGSEAVWLNALLDDPEGAFVVGEVPATLEPGQSVTVSVSVLAGRAGRRTATLSLGAGIAPISLSAQLTRWAMDGSTATASLGNDEFFDHELRLSDGSVSLVSRADELDADEAPDADTLVVAGGSLADRIALVGAALRAIRLLGGAGFDTLLGPVEDVTWWISGEGAGSVAGIEFDGFENLVGAADNRDTFDFGPVGRISGIIDGGPGGFDSLAIDANGNPVRTTANDPHSGVLSVGGNAIRYSGLEPIRITGAPDLHLGATSGDDVMTLTPSATLGKFIFDAAMAEVIEFAIPSGSLTIDGLDGIDILTISGALDFGAIPFTALAESIVLDGSITTSGAVALIAEATDASGFGPAETWAADVLVNGSVAASTVTLRATVDHGETIVDSQADLLTERDLSSASTVEVADGAIITTDSLTLAAQTLVDFSYAGIAPATHAGVSTADAEVNVDIENTTHAGMLGTLAQKTQPPAVTVSALDVTNVTATIDDTTSPVRILGTDLFYNFGVLLALVSLSRDTRASLVTDQVVEAATVEVSAVNSGTLTTAVTSDLVGIAHNTVTKDDAVARVTLPGTDTDPSAVAGLTVTAKTRGHYSATGKDARNDVTGSTLAFLTGSKLGAGAGGVTLAAEDLSVLDSQAGDLVLVPGTPLVTATAALAWNLLNRTVEASIESSTVSATGNLNVLASGNSTLRSNTEAASIAVDPDVTVDSNVLAVAGLFAANVLRGSVTAKVVGSMISAADLVISAVTDQALIDATSQVSAVAGPGTSSVYNPSKLTLGAALAINFIGWAMGQTAQPGQQALGALLATIDLLLGTTFGSEEPWTVTASATDSDLTTTGDLTVSARSAEVINSTVSNTATATTDAMFGTVSAGAGAVLASNKISSAAKAFIDSTTSARRHVKAGDLTILGDDSAGIFSNVKLVASSITTNDGGVHHLNRLVDELSPATYESNTGVKDLMFGDTVHDVAGGGIYTWMGPVTATSVNLGAPAHPFTDLGWWQSVGATDPSPEGFNVTASPSATVAAVVVLNDVRSDVVASLTDAKVAVHDLTVRAVERATIRADIDVSATASGGSSFSGGPGDLVLAASGILATNRVLGSATAIVSHAFVDATGSVVVEARNDADIEALVRASVASDSFAFGVIMAFNTIGWRPTNVFFATIDALIGDPLVENAAFGGEQQVQSRACVENSPVSATGAVRVTAVTAATIISSLGNDATSAPSSLFGFGAMAANGVFSSSRVSSGATASIIDGDLAGDLTVAANPALLAPGDRVRLAAGEMYEFVGAGRAPPAGGLAFEDFIHNTTDWRRVDLVNAAGVTVEALDDATITSTSSLFSEVSSGNDAGSGILNRWAAEVLGDYEFTSNSGAQEARLRRARPGGRRLPLHWHEGRQRVRPGRASIPMDGHCGLPEPRGAGLLRLRALEGAHPHQPGQRPDELRGSRQPRCVARDHVRRGWRHQLLRVADHQQRQVRRACLGTGHRDRLRRAGRRQRRRLGRHRGHRLQPGERQRPGRRDREQRGAVQRRRARHGKPHQDHIR